MGRFTGFCKLIDDNVPIQAMREWILNIPLEEWPGYSPFVSQDAYSPTRSTMVNDHNWRGFGSYADALMGHMAHNIYIAGEKTVSPIISALVPVQYLGSHSDGIWQACPKHLFRVHIPLQTNPNSFFIIDKPYQMNVGCAYITNVNAVHAVVNHGDCPRIHFFFDVEDAE